MRILQLGKFMPLRGGVEKVAYDLMTGLAERGHDCDMLCANAEGRGGTLAVAGNARLTSCRTWCEVAATMIAPSMIARLRRMAPAYDIIHVHHPDPMAALALCLSGYKGRVVLHWHSDIQKQRLLLRLYHPLQSWLVRRADRIVCTTPVYAEKSPHLSGAGAKTTSMPIGVEPMTEDKERAEAIKKQYGGRKIVFSLGRLVHYKGYRYLVDAAKHLGDEYAVVIGGTGKLHDELQRQIRQAGLEGRVYLIGRIPDDQLAAYYQASTLFCLPSVMKTEAFGIVQVESMANSRPVVATRIPDSGVSWVNEHGVSGLNVEPGDGQALARAIAEVSGDAGTYARYCLGARKRYESLFTKERMIDNCLKIYSELC